MLRGLSSYYYKEPTLLLLVRLAQGLVHLGKGLLTLAPSRADGTLVSGEYSQPPAPSPSAHLSSPCSVLVMWALKGGKPLHILGGSM